VLLKKYYQKNHAWKKQMTAETGLTITQINLILEKAKKRGDLNE
jgi:hypothetical protein